jgi:ribonuclease BN (tRNA processing enzyme)
VEGTEGGAPNESLLRRGHLTPREAGSLAREIGAGILVLTHLWAENDPLLAVEEARKAFGGPVELATPGMTLAWTAASD